MQLHPLEQLVDVETGVVIVEPDHDAQGDPVGAHRIHEAAAERVGGERPAQRMDHDVERLLRLPDFLDAEREDLRVRRTDVLPLQVGLTQVAAGAFGKHGDAAGEIGGLGEVGGRRPVATEARRRGAHPAHRVALDEQGVHREAGEEVDAEHLGLRAEPPHDLADRGGVVTAVVHGGRRRDALRASFGEEIDGFAGHRLAEREVAGAEVGEEVAEGAGIDDGAGEVVLAQAPGLLEHGDVELLPEPRQLDGAGEPRGPGADDQHVHLDRLGRRRVVQDELVEGERALVADGKDARHDGRLLGAGGSAGGI